MQVLDDLSRCPAAAERIPPLSALIANELAEKLARDTTDKERDPRKYRPLVLRYAAGDFTIKENNKFKRHY